MAGMLHGRNNTILFLWDKMFILMQNIFIVPGMQHGRHAKPLLGASFDFIINYWKKSKFPKQLPITEYNQISCSFYLLFFFWHTLLYFDTPKNIDLYCKCSH